MIENRSIYVVCIQNVVIVLAMEATKIVATVSTDSPSNKVIPGVDDDNVAASSSSNSAGLEEDVADVIAANNEDYVIFGARPSRLFDDISEVVDAILAEEVSTLPLLPRTLTSAQLREQQKMQKEDGRKKGEKKEEVPKIQTGEEKLLLRLRSAYKKNLDLAEVYCQRNIFTVRNYPKTKRRKILERYLADDEEGGVDSTNKKAKRGGAKNPVGKTIQETDGGEKVGNSGGGDGPSPTSAMSLLSSIEGAVNPTPEELTDIEQTILLTRTRLQNERRRKAELTKHLSRLRSASETLKQVQTALKEVDIDRAIGGVTRMTMESLKETVKNAMEGHEELKVWNTKAEEVIHILDKIKVDREGGKVVVSPSNGKRVVNREEDERLRKRTMDEIGGSHGTKEQVESFLKKLRGSVDPP